MNPNIIPTSVRLTPEEKAFLEKIAIENDMIKMNNKPSIGNALKFILREKMNEKPKASNDLNDELLKIKTMLEQMHVSMPNLAFDTRIISEYVQHKILKSDHSNEIQKQLKNPINSGLINTYGAFQTVNYDTLHCGINHKNMKTIPIEEEKNKWK